MKTSFRFVVLAAAMCLVVTGCDGNGAGGTETQPETTIPPLPTASAIETSAPPTPTPTGQPVPAADQVVALLVDPWNAALTSTEPADEGVPSDIAAAVDAAVVAGGSAEKFLAGQLSGAFNTDAAVRGDVVGGPVGEPDVSSDSVTQQACVSPAFTAIDENVDLSSDCPRRPWSRSGSWWMTVGWSRTPTELGTLHLTIHC